MWLQHNNPRYACNLPRSCVSARRAPSKGTLLAGFLPGWLFGWLLAGFWLAFKRQGLVGFWLASGWLLADLLPAGFWLASGWLWLASYLAAPSWLLRDKVWLAFWLAVGWLFGWLLAGFFGWLFGWLLAGLEAATRQIASISRGRYVAAGGIESIWEIPSKEREEPSPNQCLFGMHAQDAPCACSLSRRRHAQICNFRCGFCVLELRLIPFFLFSSSFCRLWLTGSVSLALKSVADKTTCRKIEYGDLPKCRFLCRGGWSDEGSDAGSCVDVRMVCMYVCV